jgi:hypothetical protein
VESRIGDQSDTVIYLTLAVALQLFLLRPSQPATDDSRPARAPEFIAALNGEGITVRGWSIPAYRLSKRKGGRNTLKTDRGWTNPTDKTGDLKLTTEDRWQKFGVVLKLAECQQCRDDLRGIVHMKKAASDGRLSCC